MGRVEQKDQTVVTEDGYELAVTSFVPDGAALGTLVINPAMATARQFYGQFAAWWAERGFYVVTYDYRGIGGSRLETLRGFETSVEDWAIRDIPAILNWAQQQTESPDLYVAGHSLGGQVMGLLGDRFDLRAMVTISAQSGYWKLQHPSQRWMVLAAAYGLPLVTRLLGYLPWSQLVGGEDVPKQAALQWLSWCRSPNYLFDDESLNTHDRYGRFSAPILAYSFEDDVWGYEASVDWMMGRYTNASVERIHLDPASLEVESIGHFGFFRAEMDFVWEELMDRLSEV